MSVKVKTIPKSTATVMMGRSMGIMIWNNRRQEPGPIHLGGIENFLGNGGQAGQQNHRRQGEQAPGVNQDNGEHGQARHSQPVEIGIGPEDSIGYTKETHVSQHPVNGAENRIQQPHPADCPQGDGGSPGE